MSVSRVLSCGFISYAISALLVAAATAAPLTGGTAPGGFEVVNVPGSALALWMHGSQGKQIVQNSLTDFRVASWQDQSQNGYTASALTPEARPTNATVTINGQLVDVVRFLDHPTLANRDSLTFGLASSVPNIPRDSHTMFFIASQTGGSGDRGNIIGFDKVGGRAEDGWYYKLRGAGGSNGAGVAMEAGANGNSYGYQLIDGTAHTNDFILASGRYSAADTTAQLFVNGALAGSTNSAAAALNSPTATRLNIGAYDTPSGTGAPTGFDNNFVGDIAQIVLFNRPLNTAERILVENALSAEYRLPMSVNDFYAGDTPSPGPGMRYDQGLFGIGRASDGAQVLSGGKDGMGIEALSLSNNQWALAAHEAGGNSIMAANGPGAVVQRWERDWFVDVTSSGALDANLYFNFDDAGLTGLFDASSDYVLLYAAQENGPWEILSPLSGLQGNTLVFSLQDVQTGFYTLGVTVPEPTSVALWSLVALLIGGWSWCCGRRGRE